VYSRGPAHTAKKRQRRGLLKNSDLSETYIAQVLLARFGGGGGGLVSIWHAAMTERGEGQLDGG
jgi:hypothetical protein